MQRLGYYLGGFALGLIILAFFLSGKRTSCAYGPEARVLKNINSKPFKYSNAVLKEYDTTTVKSLIEKGDVNFSKSTPRQEPCGIYLIESKIEDKEIEIVVENCDSLVKINNLSFK